MRGLCAVAGLFALVASCGFDPKPKNGKLPCDNGCPSGYVCGSDNRCWLAGTLAVDGGIDGSGAARDSAAFELGAVDGTRFVDGVSSETGREVSVDSGAAVDSGSAVDISLAPDLARADTGVAVDIGQIDGTGGSTSDAATDIPLVNPDAGCVPETDQQMCVRLGKNCDAISGTDNCGQSRSITSCGTCAAPLVCGTFAANVCPTLCVLDQTAILDQCVLGQ